MIKTSKSDKKENTFVVWKAIKICKYSIKIC